MSDRMRKALKTAGVSVKEMADYLGVARETISTWINGRHEPSKAHVMLWALRTGVPYEWIATGCTPRDLNPEPTDLGTRSAAIIPIRLDVARRAAA